MEKLSPIVCGRLITPAPLLPLVAMGHLSIKYLPEIASTDSCEDKGVKSYLIQ